MAHDTRPNILWICTDQQRYGTIAALGNPLIRAPHVDRLVAAGVAMTRAHAQSPVCTPSRASFLRIVQEITSSANSSPSGRGQGEGSQHAEVISRAILTFSTALIETPAVTVYAGGRLTYNANQNAWSRGGQLPATSQVTTTAVRWDGAIVIPTGEIRPGVRSPGAWIERLEKP